MGRIRELYTWDGRGWRARARPRAEQGLSFSEDPRASTMLTVASALALALSVAGSQPDAPVVVAPGPEGGLTLSNGLVRLEAQARNSRDDGPLLRFFTLGLATSEVLHSFHAGPTVDSPLYSQRNAFAGYRVLLHDHLRSVRAGNLSTATEASLVLEAGPMSAPCPPVDNRDTMYRAQATQTPPRGANCSVLRYASMTITLRAGASAFDVNVTAVLGEPSTRSAWIEYVLTSFEWARPDPQCRPLAITRR